MSEQSSDTPVPDQEQPVPAKRTFEHPVFVPLPKHDSLAVAYLLWMMTRKVFVKPSGCWTWSGARSERGYGILDVNGKMHRVSRVIYMYCVGDLAPDELVLHSCDNPPCCNPEHLSSGTQQENIVDCVRRNRHPHQILTVELVQQIKALLRAGSRRKALAERFGVSVGTIQDIDDGRSWRHVE